MIDYLIAPVTSKSGSHMHILKRMKLIMSKVKMMSLEMRRHGGFTREATTASRSVDLKKRYVCITEEELY